MTTNVHYARRVQPGTPPTERELQILQLIAQGLENAQIGKRLYLSPDTIKTHNLRLFRRLGALNRAHAVHIAHRQGLLE